MRGHSFIVVSRLDLYPHLLTVEADGGGGVCVLPMLEPVEDGGLATAVKPNHHTVVAAAAAQADQASQGGAARGYVTAS